MNWVQIGSALMLGAMLIFLFPRMRAAVKNSPKASAEQWQGAILPLAAVVGFVIILIMLVR